MQSRCPGEGAEKERESCGELIRSGVCVLVVSVVVAGYPLPLVLLWPGCQRGQLAIAECVRCSVRWRDRVGGDPPLTVLTPHRAPLPSFVFRVLGCLSQAPGLWRPAASGKLKKRERWPARSSEASGLKGRSGGPGRRAGSEAAGGPSRGAALHRSDTRVETTLVVVNGKGSSRG